jgi:CheY-like chemotaxis protein
MFKDAASVKSDKTYSVLIVDDNDGILEMMSHCLADLPYNFLTANTAARAMEILRTQDIAVLICDLHMSGEVNGNQILAAARAANDDLVSVLMSGRMERSAMLTALNEGGVWRYLEKPLELEEVRRVVEDSITRYIRNRQPRERLQAIASKPTVKFSSKEDAGELTVVPVRITKKTQSIVPDAALLGDRYRLMAVLGQGGTGIVYRAEDTFVHMVVAVKALHQHFTTDAKEVAILKEEARIAMTLSHRNIVRLYNMDRKDGQYFLVMEYVDGCTLNDILAQKGKMPFPWVGLVARACGSALSYAHEHGVVHQDLKPDNLLFTDNGILKIIDFGLACLIGKQPDPNHIAGTPAYMSPEQKRGSAVDARTDIYSLGIVLYELLTGKTPFPSNIKPMDALRMDPAPLEALPKDVLHILRKATALNPDDRWNSMMEFVNAFVDANAIQVLVERHT